MSVHFTVSEFQFKKGSSRIYIVEGVDVGNNMYVSIYLKENPEVI